MRAASQWQAQTLTQVHIRPHRLLPYRQATGQSLTLSPWTVQTQYGAGPLVQEQLNFHGGPGTRAGDSRSLVWSAGASESAAPTPRAASSGRRVSRHTLKDTDGGTSKATLNVGQTQSGRDQATMVGSSLRHLIHERRGPSPSCWGTGVEI